MTTTIPNKLLSMTLAVILGTVWGAPHTFAQGQPAIEVLELRFEQTARFLEGFSAEKDKLGQKIEKNDEEIQQLKSNDQLSYLERQKLEALLKASQDVSKKVAALDRKIRESQQRHTQTGQQLIKLYESEIDKAVAALEKGGQNAQNRQAFLNRIDRLRHKRTSVQQAAGLQKVDELQINQLDISPDDTPRQVRQKGDLLKDQEEKYRTRARALQARAAELQKELDLRTRVSEMVEDLALFDQQEEALTNLASQSGESAVTAGLDVVESSDRAALAGETILVGQKDFDFITLSGDVIEDLIENLAHQEQEAEARADSLSLRAAQFYHAAEELKKQ